jgi:outer membrane immunogenic protein
MKKLLVACIAAAACCGAPALAADMPVKAPAVAAPVPMFNWTGFYVGGHAGGLWSEKHWTFIPDPTITASPEPTGFLGGLQAGYNFQSGAWVFGVEGSYSWADASARDQFTQPGAPVYGHSTIDSLATLTGRVGYAAWQRSLIYVKGGAAWLREKHWEETTTAGNSETEAQNRAGWIVGAGLEYALPSNWSVALEYNYMDFGTKRVLFTVFNDLNDIKQRVQLVKVGLNYRFGGGLR